MRSVCCARAVQAPHEVAAATLATCYETSAEVLCVMLLTTCGQHWQQLRRRCYGMPSALSPGGRNVRRWSAACRC